MTKTWNIPTAIFSLAIRNFRVTELPGCVYPATCYSTLCNSRFQDDFCASLLFLLLLRYCCLCPSLAIHHFEQPSHRWRNKKKNCNKTRPRLTLSEQPGVAFNESSARRFTHAFCCPPHLRCPRRTSMLKEHSPLVLEARICHFWLCVVRMACIHRCTAVSHAKRIHMHARRGQQNQKRVRLQKARPRAARY